jgi:signal transduction histidine kinase
VKVDSKKQVADPGRTGAKAHKPGGNESWIETHLSGVAHDLRGPLSVVSGHAQVLRRLAAGGAPAERVLASAEAILRATDRMAAILEELSAAARASDARMGVTAVPVDELIAGLAKGTRARQVSFEIAPELPPVAVDPHVFRHRAGVLLAALRTGRGDAPLTVRVERRGAVVRIAFPDAWLDLPVA